MRKRPTDAYRTRLLRRLQTRFAMSSAEVMEMFGSSRSTAWRMLQRLQDEGLIYLRYRDGSQYYSLKRKL